MSVPLLSIHLFTLNIRSSFVWLSLQQHLHRVCICIRFSMYVDAMNILIRCVFLYWIYTHTVGMEETCEHFYYNLALCRRLKPNVVLYTHTVERNVWCLITILLYCIVLVSASISMFRSALKIFQEEKNEIYRDFKIKYKFLDSPNRKSDERRRRAWEVCVIVFRQMRNTNKENFRKTIGSRWSDSDIKPCSRKWNRMSKKERPKIGGSIQ